MKEGYRKIISIISAVALSEALIVQALPNDSSSQRNPSESSPATSIEHSPEPTTFIKPTPIPKQEKTSEPTLQPTPQPTKLETSQPVIKPETASSIANFITHGNLNRPEISLTFDGGAGSTNTPAILDILKQKGVKTTMFLTGLWMEQNPKLVKRIVSEGHEICNHSYDHSDFRNLSSEGIKEQLKRTEEIAKRLTGKSTIPCFRPPYGGYDPRVTITVANEGYTHFVYWNIDPIDWDYSRTAEDIYQTVMTKASNGSIVLMHLDSLLEPKILGKIIDDVRTRGFSPTTLTNILKN